ncbi:hypothetical protein OU798_02725 [Prolixibacteraceae bacterium Z1-6]|uniref:Uncharacterized protein n=1 Tax=Draconibacterium aestuarii TaxID=2998507 RepID=A0A9X3J634_9BACT|nr:hypothetical protein [Prolixibacteraceae bacterium Z1-6]
MNACKTNRLLIDFNYENILRDFTIIQFSTTENYIKYGAVFLDEINLKTNAQSIVFEQGSSFYALYLKKEFEAIDIAKQLHSLNDTNALIFNVIETSKDCKMIPPYLLAQLLVNSISTPQHKRLSFNNLTGKLYLFNPKHFKTSKTKEKELIFKIIALEFKINNTLSLELNVKTFSNVLLSKKMDFGLKKFSEYSKYTFVHSTNSLKRILTPDGKSENQFILKQTYRNGTLEKNSIDFLDFKDLESFNASKVGILKETLKTIEDKLADYLNISFQIVESDNTIRYKNTFKIEDFGQNITLIDSIQEEESTEFIRELKQNIENIAPLCHVKISNKVKKNGFNIKLLHNRNYYEKYKLTDPHKASVNVQHITSQDFSTDSKASIKAILKELVIKNDIANNEVTIVDWKEFNYSNDWIFGTKYEDEFYFMTIKPNGHFTFEKFIRDLFNQSEFDDLCDIFDNSTNIEFIVKDNNSNVNSIKRTQDYTLPEFDEIHEILSNESESIKLSKEEAETYVKEIIDSDERLNQVLHSLNLLETWNKRSLLNCLSRTEKKQLTDLVKIRTGEILKSYLRDKTRYEILDSQLDIHQFQEKDKYYYFVGVKGAGIQQQISRASIIREIEVINNSTFIFDKLLPLMNVDFVKNGDLTVMPFPMKYLRECIISQRRN